MIRKAWHQILTASLLLVFSIPALGEEKGRPYYIGNLEKSDNNYVITIKSNDFDPILKAQDRAFGLGIQGKTYLIKASARLEQQGIEKVVRLLFASKEHLETPPEGYGVVVSLQPLPVQTWTMVEPKPQDIRFAKMFSENRIKKIEKSLRAQKKELHPREEYARFDLKKVNTKIHGMLLLVNFGTPETDDEWMVTHTAILQSSRGGPWKELSDTRGISASPFIDIDGDGVPETHGGTQYEYQLDRIFPTSKTIVTAPR